MTKGNKRKPPHDGLVTGPAIGNTDASGSAHFYEMDAARPHKRSHLVSFGMGDAYYRNLYMTDPDFRQISKLDADFASFVKPNGQLDFTDPAAVRQLTKTLLRLDFGLKIDLPDDRLCPPVPNRHNYILWLKGLIDTTSGDEPRHTVSGLDIGTGASCIYPLLACAQRQWRFVGTDIDDKSLDYARKNVELNGLQGRIQILRRQAANTLIPLDHPEIDSIDFVMMNPPFYESERELILSAEAKSRPPYSACTGSPCEMVCQGGEVEFVGRLLSESLILRHRVQWYTSMLGKLSSLEILIGQLRDHGIDNYAVTEFIQGSKTRRWAIAWSFGPMRPAQGIARGMKPLQWKKILPLMVEVVMHTVVVGETGALSNKIDDAMRPLELMSWVWDKEKLSGTGRAWGNVWGRAWRRRKMREQNGVASAEVPRATLDTNNCVFGFRLTVQAGLDKTTATCRWAEGHDEALFQSFVGYLEGRLKDMST